MTKTSVNAVLSELGYDTDAWIKPSKIAYFALAGCNNRYLTADTIMHAEFYFDSTNEIMSCREVITATGEQVRIVSMTPYDEILGIVLLSKYTEQQQYGMSVPEGDTK